MRLTVQTGSDTWTPADYCWAEPDAYNAYSACSAPRPDVSGQTSGITGLTYDDADLTYLYDDGPLYDLDWYPTYSNAAQKVPARNPAPTSHPAVQPLPLATRVTPPIIRITTTGLQQPGSTDLNFSSHDPSNSAYSNSASPGTLSPWDIHLGSMPDMITRPLSPTSQVESVPSPQQRPRAGSSSSLPQQRSPSEARSPATSIVEGLSPPAQQSKHGRPPLDEYGHIVCDHDKICSSLKFQRKCEWR